MYFHLKNPIMIGKKKHLDVQFFTEVVDASQAVDDRRRSMYDPDEMDDEQREPRLQLDKRAQDGEVLQLSFGKAGGEDVKRAVAQELGVRLIIIERPTVIYPKQTKTLDEVLAFAADGHITARLMKTGYSVS